MPVIMNATTKTTSSKPAGAPMSASSQAVREMAEKGAAQAKETYEKMSAATSEATDLIKNSCSTAVKGAQDFNNKLLEFAQTNTNVAFDFAQRLLGVISPSEFAELSTEHARKQFETLTEQTRELAALGQKLALATAEPLKTGVTKAFGDAA
jgi:phasin